MSIEIRQHHQDVRHLHRADASAWTSATASSCPAGPSGSGKTTLLRIIAGLEFPDRGRDPLRRRGRGRGASARRQVGFVFQHYALFRHMTVFENIAFGLRVRPRR